MDGPAGSSAAGTAGAGGASAAGARGPPYITDRSSGCSFSSAFDLFRFSVVWSEESVVRG